MRWVLYILVIWVDILLIQLIGVLPPLEDRLDHRLVIVIRTLHPFLCEALDHESCLIKNARGAKVLRFLLDISDMPFNTLAVLVGVHFVLEGSQVLIENVQEVTEHADDYVSVAHAFLDSLEVNRRAYAEVVELGLARSRRVIRCLGRLHFYNILLNQNKIK